jgi:O-antigen ligase
VRSRDLASAACAIAAITTAVVVVGGAFRWTQAIVAGLVGAALIPHFLSRRTLGRVSPLVAMVGVPAALTALSLFPLPRAILEAADPIGSALRDDGAALADVAPWRALTRDVPGSLRALAYFIILLGVAVVALRMSASERSRYRVLLVVALACALAGVILGVHALVGAHELYGIYKPNAAPSVIGPLLNENHLGCLMAIGTCVAAGLTMYRRQSSWRRAALLVVVLVCGAATAASGSRGALLALFAGGLVTGGILLAQRFLARHTSTTARRRSAQAALPIAIVAVCVVVLVVYSSAGRVTEELDRSTLAEINQPRSKFAAWKSTKALIAESPWIGVGRGGFEPSFTRVHPASGNVTFSHVENEYIQTLVDWGVVGALAVTAAMLWFAAVAVRRWRDGPLAAGAIGALTAVAVQSNVDFGVELLGVGLPITAVAATVAYVPLRDHSGGGTRVARVLRVALLLGLASAGTLLLSRTTTSIQEDHERLQQPSASLAEIRESIERHPLDYYGYARAADVVGRAGDPTSIRYLNQAMLLHPTHPDLHRLAGRLLLRAGQLDQAALEYAAALRPQADPELLLTEIVKLFPTQAAALAIPVDYHWPEAVLGYLHKLKRDDVAILWLRSLIQAHPRDIRMCNMVYEFALSRRDLQAAEVAGRHCLELLPDRQTRLSLAQLLVQRGSYAEAIRLVGDVATWQGRVADKKAAWFALCDAHTGLGQWEDAKRCLRRLEVSGFVPPEEATTISDRLDAVQKARAAADSSSQGSQHSAPL